MSKWERVVDITDASLVGVFIGFCVGMIQFSGLDQITAWIAAVVSLLLCGAAIARMRWSSPPLVFVSGVLIITSAAYVMGYNGMMSNILYDAAIIASSWLVYHVSGCPRGGCVRR